MRVLRKATLSVITILFVCLFCACGNSTESGVSSSSTASSDGAAAVSSSENTADSADAALAGTTWVQITQEEAARIMAEETGYLIVDVRTQEEFAEGHIPGAICIPNETIGTEEIPELPDKDQTLLVYCRSGRRSKEAAEKLAGLGYSDVREFGGIIDWTGEIVTEETKNEDQAANASGTEDDPDEMAEAIRPTAVLVIEAGGRIFYADLEDNSSAEAFRDKLNSEALEVDLHDYGSFEKVGPLPFELPTNDEQITTEPGDVILYQGDQITIYYDVNTWSFTRLAKIEDVTKEELLEAFGDGDVTVSFHLEWSE